MSFGGITAINNLNLRIKKGEVLAIIGPNGAGKTTIFNVISRFYTPQQGSIKFENKELLEVSASSLAPMGISRTFQNIELFNQTTVLQNLLIAQYAQKTTSFFSEIFFLPSARRQEISFRKTAESIIDFLELSHYRYHQVASLPYGVKKMVEIARALCLRPKLILLDEPSSGFNQEETDDLSHWIDDIREELGITVLLIEHNMKLVEQVADRVAVLAEGKLLDLGSLEKVRSNPKVISAYLG